MVGAQPELGVEGSAGLHDGAAEIDDAVGLDERDQAQHVERIRLASNRNQRERPFGISFPVPAASRRSFVGRLNPPAATSRPFIDCVRPPGISRRTVVLLSDT